MTVQFDSGRGATPSAASFLILIRFVSAAMQQAMKELRRRREWENPLGEVRAGQRMDELGLGKNAFGQQQQQQKHSIVTRRTISFLGTRPK